MVAAGAYCDDHNRGWTLMNREKKPDTKSQKSGGVCWQPASGFRPLSSVFRFLVAGSLFVLGAAPLAAQDSIPDGTLLHGRLGFSGHGTPGPWSAWTDTMTGAMAMGAALADVHGWVEFPAATLDSDNGRRDKDMRKSLETDKYPTIRFDLNGVTDQESFGDSTSVTILGTFHIHGVDREVEALAMIHFGGEDNEIRLTADIPLNLKDYEIGGLSKMLGILKMNPAITVHVDVVFSGELGAGS